MSLATVQARFGRGGIFTARDAVAAGLADEVATFERSVGLALELPGRMRAERLTAELQRDVVRLNAGFPVSELESTKRRRAEEATARLRRYADKFTA